MVRIHRLALLVGATLLLSVAVQSQQKPPLRQVPPAQAGAARISLNVVVTAKNGVPVGGLPQSDFKLLVDNTPVPISSFRAIAGKAAPVEVLLVIDAVNAPYSGVSYMRGQIENFLRANGGQLAFPTSLAIFTDKGVQIQGGFSRDGNADAEALEHADIELREINRTAGFWGATERFQNSVSALRNLTARAQTLPGRKLVIWISPGWPLLTGPGITLDTQQERGIFADVVAFSTAIRQAGVTLYDVNPIGPTEGLERAFYYRGFLKGVSKAGQVDPADLSLQVLATQSGGLVQTSTNDLIGGLQKCVADGSAFYELSFDAPPADRRDSYHSIDVQIAAPGLTARTTQGFYGQP